MKNYIIIISLLATGLISAQTAIEKTVVRGAGTLLDFNDQEVGGVAKGIILPIVDDPSTAQPGTLLLDATTETVRYKDNNGWVDLTDAANTDYESPALDDVGEGAVIRDGSISFVDDTDPGALKLSSDQKAMILPHVNDVTVDISNPEPGTIAFDRNSNSLAIYNGENWSFWN